MIRFCTVQSVFIKIILQFIINLISHISYNMVKKANIDRMQLWSDRTFTEFAIRLNEIGFVAVSNNETVFSEIMDELPCNDAHYHDWRRTLTEWVNSFLRNLHGSEYELGSSTWTPESQLSARGLVSISKSYSNYMLSQLPSFLLRCECCNLNYVISEEYEAHQHLWHSQQTDKSM